MSEFDKSIFDPLKPVVGSLFESPVVDQRANSVDWREMFTEFVGSSHALNRVLEFVYKVAKTESVVLIRGESGTGKELIAQSIHRLSKRSSRPIITVNCSAIPENLLESELFGHKKGSFTGAVNSRKGVFEEAQGGTIFLDEIGDMDYKLQAKLLRVLQEKTYTPVGSSDQKKANVRIIAATNVNLEKAIEDSKFREDLFYRLNVLPVYSPSLRERKEDIPAFVRYFTDISNRSHNISAGCFFTQQAVQWMQDYSWPGNIRELQNMIERLVITVGGGAIDVDHLPRECFSQNQITPKKTSVSPSVGTESPRSQLKASFPVGELPESGISLTDYIAGIENSLIMQALERTGNNKNQAAKLLGLNRTTLVERIKKRKIGKINLPSKEL